MRILFHLGGVVLSIFLFLMGNLLIRNHGRYAQSFPPSMGSNEKRCNFFLYAGRTFKVVGSIGGLLEAVSVVLLTSGVVIDAVLTM